MRGQYNTPERSRRFCSFRASFRVKRTARFRSFRTSFLLVSGVSRLVPARPRSYLLVSTVVPSKTSRRSEQNEPSFRAKRAVVPSKTNRSYERGGTSGETVTTVAASYTSMELTWADGTDTPCAVCGGDACDWVQVRDGTRRYGCQECLEALLRYREDTTLAEIPDTPDAVVCQACGEFTLEADTGPTNRCAACAPEDTDALLEQVQAALEG